MDGYGTIEVRNGSGRAIQLSVTTPDGVTHDLATLAAGATSTQLTPPGARWSLEVAADTADRAEADDTAAGDTAADDVDDTTDSDHAAGAAAGEGATLAAGGERSADGGAGGYADLGPLDVDEDGSKGTLGGKSRG